MLSPGAPEVSVAELAAALAHGATLVDVREPAEYVAAHVGGARSIPLGELLDRHGEIVEDIGGSIAEQTVYVICAVGGRSLAAAGALRQLGYEAVSVAGGTNGWIAEERPVVTGPESTERTS